MAKSTIEYLGEWEMIHNPNFKVVEFDHFRMQAGMPNFVMSVKHLCRSHQRWYSSGRTSREAQPDSHPADAGTGRQ